MKTTGLSTILAAAVVSASAMSAPSYAAEAATENCGCAINAISGAPIGEITSVDGKVLRASDDGYVAAQAGDMLSTSGQILTSSEASANIVLSGGCSVELDAMQSLWITKVNSGYCLRVTENYLGTQSATFAADKPTGVLSGGNAGGGTAGGAGGGGAAAGAGGGSILGVSTTTLVVVGGAAAVAGGIAFAISETTGENSASE